MYMVYIYIIEILIGRPPTNGHVFLPGDRTGLPMI